MRYPLDMSALPPLKSCHTATATHTAAPIPRTHNSLSSVARSVRECGDVSELVRADCVSFLSKSGFRSPTVSPSQKEEDNSCYTKTTIAFVVILCERSIPKLHSLSWMGGDANKFGKKAIRARGVWLRGGGVSGGHPSDER